MGAQKGLMRTQCTVCAEASNSTTNGHARVFGKCTPLLSKNLYSRLRNHSETLARMHEDASLQDTKLVVFCNHAHSALGSFHLLCVCVLSSQPIDLQSEKCPGCVRPTALEIHLLTRCSRRKKLGRGFRSSYHYRESSILCVCADRQR